ncbi:hypothetical protein FNF29_08474 [Cafeteria roenbergensis]|uniref:G domain-containing protein n=1 Tax=Cafeteria roenbergensis TaxID=33653 RepID=A0A5A8BY08_CAFRO|nr:hypothetical protein FNF29_08474 [Cafeteria roenbergensis]|eukprot:KAA0145573.1 hypothetical protein FNF29_08474 [Cafeteria roenbergensis]
MEGAAAAAQAGDHLICQRCYHAKHYGRLVPVEADEETFPRIRARHSAPARARCSVVDLSTGQDRSSRTCPAFLRLDRADVDLVVAINKCDLLPKRAPRERIEAWARAGLRAAGLSNDRIASLALVSARTGEGI